MTSQMALEINRPKHDTDPKAAIFEACEDVLKGVRITGSDILVCVYERPGKIIVGKDALGRDLEIDTSATSRTLEDKIQGRVGLVVAIGPLAGQHADFFGGDMPKVGDWVLLNGSDAVPFVGGYKPQTRVFRLVQANFVRAVLGDPDIVL